MLSSLALKRADSSASSTTANKRKVSSISGASDASDEHDHEDQHMLQQQLQQQQQLLLQQQQQQQPESPLFDVPEEGDNLEENMPWLKTVAKLVNGFNFYCTHQVRQADIERAIDGSYYDYIRSHGGVNVNM